MPFIGRLRHRNHGESRVWALGHRPRARSARSSRPSRAGGLLLVLALPALNMKTINPGAAGLPHDLPIMQTYERIQAAFPGGPMPALVVVEANDVTAPAVQKGIEELKATASGPTSTIVSPNKQRRDRLPPAARQRHRRALRRRAGASCATTRSRPRSAGSPGTETNVTGMTAGSKDFNDKMNSRLPIVFAFVLGLAFLLLLVTFRSIVVPLKAIVLNLLSRRRRLRHPHVRLPVRPLRGPAELPVRRRDHVLAAAVPVRDPVRALDGLPRVHHQPHPRGGRRRDEDRGRRRARHQGHGRRRHQRGDRDGRGVRDLRQRSS